MSFFRRTLRRSLAILPIALLAFVWAACAGDYPQTTFQPVTDQGAAINDLFSTIFWWTMLVLGVVLVVLMYVLVRYRDRPGATPSKTYGNNVAEILWTLGPAVIVVFILVPTIQTIFESYEPGGEDALIVEAVGHQWWWEFRYPQLGVTTANQMHIPVGQRVEVRLSSNDVLHNWWVPRLAGKRYNYPVAARPADEPDRNNFHILTFTVEEPGEYSGQCAEFCGESHALMRMLVVATDDADFEDWVERMRGSESAQPVALAGDEAESLEARGYQAFVRNGCTACHAIAGTPFVSRIGPDLTTIGERWAIGAGTLPNTPEHMANWIRDSDSYKPGSKMLPFPNISDEDMVALVAYLQSLR